MPGDLSISLIGDEMLRRMLEHVQPSVVAEIERAVETVARDAEAAWPVGRRSPSGRDRRPHSRDLFRTDVRVVFVGGGVVVEGSVSNGADYARYIRPKGLGGKSAVIEYIRKPMKRERDRILAKLADLARKGLADNG